MSRHDKLVERFKSLPNDFTWSELQRLLKHYGYEVKKGSGSKRKFLAKDLPLISLHEPHPKPQVNPIYLKMVLETLEAESLL